MDRPKRVFPMADLLVLACALVLLASFFFMPWFQLEDGSDATGWKLAADTDNELDLPVRISHMFLIVLPVSAVGAIFLVLISQLFVRTDHTQPVLLMLLGLVVVIYYYGMLFYENHQNKTNARDFIGSGFWVGLAAALGLIVQVGLPRPGWRLRLTIISPIFPPLVQPRAAWRWPFVLIKTALRWLWAIIHWLLSPVGKLLAGTPVLAYLIGLWAATELEFRDGLPFARLLGFRKEPSLFGASDVLEPFRKLDFSGILSPFFPAPADKVDKPLQASWEAIKTLAETFVEALSTQGKRDPGFFSVFKDVLEYDLFVFIIPVIIIALLFKRFGNRLLLWLPSWAGLILQGGVLYLALARWASLSGYRELILIYMGINVMLAASLNLVNGYMGEFSVGHAGFMAVGAYVSAVITMWAFTDSKEFGAAHLPIVLDSTFGFVVALLAGGVCAALAGLLVAFPSFRTRGDYLAIITLAVNFIITGAINNMEFIGGPRGLNGIPIWTNLPWVFGITALSILAIYNLVNSTFGKGIIAIREDEISAELMGVHTRRVKLVAFVISSFIAGVSGGLFVHVLASTNPGSFGILKSTEALVMVYLGGMGSISGSVIAAVLFTVLTEALRPLEVLKWVVIPLILIILMLRRPQGLFGFRELKLNLRGIHEVEPEAEEVRDGAVRD
jgi:branched-chain amino acid transport system permease protein